MPALALLEMIAQVFFAVHAIKTGRDRYWLYVIIILPGIGCLIYFFAEYLPELQQSQKLKRSSERKKKLSYLKDQVEILPSVKNKKDLAEGYINKGLFDEAIALYHNCLEELNEDDPSIIEGLCCAYFFRNSHKTAQDHLLKLREIRGKIIGDEFDLLLARTYEALGDFDNALNEYSKIIKIYAGEEARCRYALLLEKTGKTHEAKEWFNTIIKNAKFSPKFYRKAQKKWIDIATRHI